jgi:hypothetical protein
MPVNVNGTILTGGTSLTVTDASSNVLYKQGTTGLVSKPTNSSGTILTPMFNVGMGTDNRDLVSGVVVFNYTSGSGYTNINSCYNTSNGAFTAPFTGLYLFKEHVYIYSSSGAYTNYLHPLFLVNGSTTARRPGGTPYRMRLYGLPGSYGYDTDCSELIYLTAGDYVQVYFPVSGQIYGYAPYSTFNGSYISN